MNKEKYLKELEKRLVYLKDEDKQTEIFRVSNNLDSGKDMKDLSLEVKEIYEKYNINVEKQAKKNTNKTVKKMNGFAQKFDNFIKKLKKNSFKENLVIFRDLIILVLLVAILKIPFIFVETMLDNFSGTISLNILNVLHYVIEILYVIFAIFFFIRIFKRRFKEELK